VASFLPTIVSIDVEPDRRPASRTDRAPWEGWDACAEAFGAARERFARATGAPVHWSWFFRTDPQIEAIWGAGGWPISSRRERVAALVAAGDELGVHCHAFRWDATGDRWVSDQADPENVARCVDASLDAFEAAVGRRCRSFRFGARWLDDATVARLAARGVEFDLTVEPGFPPIGAEDSPDVLLGDAPDYRRAARDVHRPGPDFRAAARDGEPGPALWMVPLSTGTPERGAHALRRRARNLLRPRGARAPRPWAPLCLAETPRVFSRVLDRLLADRRTRHLSVVVRTDAALEPARRGLEANLEALASRAERRAMRIVRPDEAVAALGG
jgi:hypothetical protein